MKYKVWYRKSRSFGAPLEKLEHARKHDYTLICETQAKDLEDLFRKMNVVDGTELPIKLKVRSMSVDDIAESEFGTLCICQSFGWADIIGWA